MTQGRIAYSPAENDSELVMEIGKITVRYAMLEALMGDLVGHALGIPVSKSEALVAHLGLKTKIEMAGSLIHETESDELKKQYLLEIISQAEKTSKSRNAFSHQLIGYASDVGEGLYAHQSIARGDQLRVKKNSVSVLQARNVADQLGAINLGLVRVILGDKPWAVAEREHR